MQDVLVGSCCVSLRTYIIYYIAVGFVHVNLEIAIFHSFAVTLHFHAFWHSVLIIVSCYDNDSVMLIHPVEN